MKNLFRVLIFISFISEFCFSQKVFGRVILDDSEFLTSPVLILIKPLNLHFYSDLNGNFEAPILISDSLTIEFALIGYKKEIKKIFLASNQKLELNVTLKAIPFLLNEVVVTGTFQNHLLKNTPIITEVIDNKNIENFNSQTLADLLPLHTGIEITQSLGQNQNLKLQGLKKNQVLILVDGERISGKVDDAIDVGQIPISTIEKIEIVKGPLSSVYGSEAIGGVVNIISKKPQDEFNFYVNSTFGSFNRKDLNAYSSNSFTISKNIKYSILLNSGIYLFDGIDFNKNDFIQELSSFNKKYIIIKNDFNVENKLIINSKNEILFEDNSWLAGGSKYVYFEDFSENKKLTNTLNSKYFLSENSYVNFTLNNSNFKHKSFEKTNTGNLVRSNNSLEDITTYRFNICFSPYNTSVIIAGIEKNIEEVNSQRILTGNKSVSTNVFYFEDEWNLKSFILNFGGRYSDNSVFGKFFVPRLSLLYNTNPNLIFRASFGKGFRAPSLNELYIDFNHSSVGYKIEGNPNLQPETSTGINFGMDYSRDELVWFRINLYKNSVINLIEYFNKPGTSQPVIISYKNIDKANIFGTDLDIDLRLNESSGINIGYNYITNLDNNQLLFQSPNSAILKFNKTFINYASSIFLIIKWIDIKKVSDEQFNTSSYENGNIQNYISVPSYFVWNLNISNLSIKYWKINFGINNILNITHYPFGQSKPRELSFSITYSNN